MAKVSLHYRCAQRWTNRERSTNISPSENQKHGDFETLKIFTLNNLMAGVENPVVLMLHGFLGSPKNWRACAEAMAVRRRVLVPELPFFGGHPPPDPIEHFLKFLVALIAAEQAGRVVVMGNSFGGQLAVHLALREPERVVGLVLTGSGGLYQPKSTRQFHRHRGREWLRGQIREIFFDESFVTDELVDELMAISNDLKKLKEILRLAKNTRKVSVRELLPRIHCPVLLVWGADDKITPPSAAREFQKLLPDAELHFISQCGHAPMLERPVEFTRLVEDFLRRVSARKA
jgi:pimeloyl-ACP methyl ester carboxylesterase